MRNTKDGGRHPSKGLLETPTYIGQVGRIAQFRHTTSAHAVKLSLGYFWHILEYGHSLDKADELGRRRLRSCLKKRATDICAYLVGKPLNPLFIHYICPKTWLWKMGYWRSSLGARPETYNGFTFAHLLLDIQVLVHEYFMFFAPYVLGLSSDG